MRLPATKILAFLSLIFLLALPTQAASSSKDDSHNPVYNSKLGTGLSVGFGTLEQGNSRSDLRTSPGFNLHGEYVFNGPQFASWGKYLAIGGRSSFLFYTPPSGSIQTTISITPYGKVQYAVSVPHGYLGLRAILPVGVHIGAIPSQDPMVGWTIGILPGLEYFFDEHWGVSTELGFVYGGFPQKRNDINAFAGLWSLNLNYAF